ncbi:MAG: Glycosyltransferase WbsX, partial [Rhodobacteraceae bacterium HLUCCA24]
MLWLSPQDAYADGDDLAGIAGKGDQFAQERHKGFICAQEASFDRATAPAELLNAIGTAVSRIGLAMPRTPCPVPAGGAIWVRPLLFRGLGPSVRPFEMTPDGGGGTFPGRETLLGMLGLLAREAGMGNAPPPTPAEPAKRDVKTVAFYLPQFHPIPENDRWWGRGFTEWNNVTRGKPLFRNHYQPRVPADLGYYDLRLEDVQVAQADLARDFGLHGFCYYYYWFNGKKLLNQPVEQMARSDRIDTGFCVCWANENWSRNWDGQNRHVLLKQEYSLESNVALIRELIPMMKDPRWIRFRGKPVMVVYRISIIPNWLETARLWREECRRAGLGEIHLCAVRFGLEPLQGPPEEHGLDSYVLFPPHEAAREDLRDKVLDLHRDFGGEVFDYSAVVDGDLQRFASGYDWPVHRGMMLGWDNTARRLTDARVFHGATPYGLRRWMQGVLEQDARHNPDPESLIFVNAWNEWAEGTYLEPDQRWGRASLEALRSAVEADPVARPVVVPEGTARRPRTDALMKRAGEPLRDEGKALRPMEWIPGKRRPAADAPTVMLCAHIAGHQLFGGERSFLDVLDALSQMPLNVIVTLPSGNNRSYVDEICERCVRAYVFAYPQWMDNRDPHGWLTLNFA